MSKLRSRISVLKDSTSELVDVPEWKCSIEIRSMTGKQRAEVFRKTQTLDDDVSIELLYPELIIATAFDPEDGERIFEDDDVEFLNGRSASVLERLASAALRVSGLTKEAESEAGKGSSATAANGSTSSSPETSG